MDPYNQTHTYNNQYNPQHRKWSLDSENYDVNTPEYLSWRRLHLSKSKLSNVAELASFMSGFSIVAVVELQINDGDSNSILLTAFVVATSLLVATSMIVVMISTCILPQLTAVTKMSKCPSPEVSQSPHDSLIRFIDLSWILSNAVCLFLFTFDLILVVWIKFTHFSYTASVAATCILVPCLFLIVIFGLIFYRKIIMFQYDLYSKKYEELEEIQKQLSHMNREMTRANSFDVGVVLDANFHYDLELQDETPGSESLPPIPRFVGETGSNNENYSTYFDDDITMTPTSFSSKSSTRSSRKRNGGKYSSRIYNV